MGTGVAPAPKRQAGSLPFPGEHPGTPNGAMPFDHIVVVRHTRPDEVVQVVRVVVPGLEGTRLRNASLGERALRRTALPRPE